MRRLKNVILYGVVIVLITLPGLGGYGWSIPPAPGVVIGHNSHLPRFLKISP